MELSKTNKETLIWNNINDSRNLEVITSEEIHIRDFVPKIATVRHNEIIKESIPETNIQDILNIKYKEQNVYEILGHQVTVISYLSAKFRSTDCNEILWKFYRPFLQWILETSEFITCKFNIPVEEIKQSATVVRSSYKFCNLKEACNDTFGNPLGSSLSSEKGRFHRCQGDHFVHNKITRDLKSLISVIDIESSEQGPMSHYLRLGLTTTDFVIRHMYQELDIFNTWLKDKVDFNIDDYYVCNKCKSNRPNGFIYKNNNVKQQYVSSAKNITHVPEHVIEHNIINITDKNPNNDINDDDSFIQVVKSSKKKKSKKI